jgi:hypothetical protein
MVLPFFGERFVGKEFRWCTYKPPSQKLEEKIKFCNKRLKCKLEHRYKNSELKSNHLKHMAVNDLPRPGRGTAIRPSI